MNPLTAPACPMRVSAVLPAPARRRTAGLLLALLGIAAPVVADDRWNGGGGDRAWSTDANWVDGVAPPAGDGGVITFDNAGMGTNTVDLDWTLHSLLYSNNVASGHTTIVADARTLLINGAGGSLTVGNTMSNCVVAIRGGTVQLGDGISSVNLSVGYATAGTHTNPPSRLVLSSALNAYNISNFYVARYTAAAVGLTAEADLSGCTISRGATANTLKACNFMVAGGGGRYPKGALRLPASLADLDAGTFMMANGSGSYGGTASLDFGDGSQLRRLVASNTFYLAKNGIATLSNWPAGVTVLVGSADSPAPMTVGCSEGATGCGAALCLTNGSFFAHLSSLKIGCNSSVSVGTALGVLGLAETVVQIGDTPNAIRVPELRIGGSGGEDGRGTLRLPPAITEIETGIFDLANGSGALGGVAVLDLGAGSQLRKLVASNIFYLAKNGIATLSNWPAGVTVLVGSADSPAPMTVGCSQGESGCGATLSLTNGQFTAHLSSLKIGCNSSVSIGTALGVLGLSETTVQIGDTPNAIRVPELRIGGGLGEVPRGTLQLPSAITEIEVGTLDLASGSGGNGGIAVLDLGAGSQLRKLVASNIFYLAKNGIATISNWPAGVTVLVGSADSPAPMTVGCSEGETGCAATLSLTNGQFTAHLSSLKIGCNSSLTIGTALGVLSLAETAVQIGDTPNAIRIPEIRLGAGGGEIPRGTLRLPPALTEIEVGTLDMANGSLANGGLATLDFGPSSLLRKFAASNAFYLGQNGTVTLSNWPAGVTVLVGTAESPAPMKVGCAAGETACAATLSLTNGRFSAHLSDLAVGANLSPSAGSTVGRLNLTNTALGALEVGGDLSIGASTSVCFNGKGFVYLPAGAVTIASNLYVGDTHAGSQGVLELFGTTVTVGTNVLIGATGAVTNHLLGAPGGLNLLGSDSNNLVIASGGKLHVAFEAEPASARGYYWGLRMAGNQVDYVNDLNAAGRLTWSLDGLSAASQARFGIVYRPAENVTLMGLAPHAGAFLTVR